MNQKCFINIFVAVAIVVAIGIGAYFVFMREQAPTTETQSPTPTVQQNLSKIDETKDWTTFTNTKYNYGFKHPQDSSVQSEEFGADETVAFKISLIRSKARFNVEAQDPEVYSFSPTAVQTTRLPLKEFVQEIWRGNKEDINPNSQNKKVGQISQTTVSGKMAYQFTLTGSYHDKREHEGSGYTLEKKYLYLFVENKGLNFMIWLPVDDPTARTIFESFKFINK